MRGFLKALPVLALALAAGCQGYKVVQTVHFIDDDGNIVIVDYGISEKYHVNTFAVPPVNGHPEHEEEFKSKLAVNVTLPDGNDFTAWQCMNFGGKGTLYRTDDEEWYFRANGFTCEVFLTDERDKRVKRPVFRGVLCNNMPGKKPEKDTRWRTLKPGEHWAR